MIEVPAWLAVLGGIAIASWVIAFAGVIWMSVEATRAAKNGEFEC